MALHQLGSSLAPGFDAPLGILEGCHGRILMFCERLEILAEHLSKQGVDAQALEVAASIAHYFNTAGHFHHQDEEQDLFPMLEKLDGGMKALIEDLLAAHRELDNAWSRLSPMLEALEEVDTECFGPVAEAFVEMNREHVALENRELLPIAQNLLDKSQLEQLGRAMAKRRNVQYISSDSGDMA